MSDPLTDLELAEARRRRAAGPLARRLGRRPSLVIGALLVALFCVASLFAPQLAGVDPDAQPDAVAGKHLPPWSRRVPLVFRNGRSLLAESAERRGGEVIVERLGRQQTYPAAEIANLPPDGGVPEPRLFPLGSDRFSRDLWSRLLYGGRVSLAIGLLSVVIALGLGTLIGAVAGMASGVVDGALMRFTDACLAIPRIFLLLLLGALFDPGLAALVVAIGATTWMPVARLVRGELLSLRERSFVTAARGLGAGPLRLAVVHLLPNALTPVAVYAGVLIGGVILLESALSFLGFGVQQPTPSWGEMIARGFDDRLAGWWVTTMPGLALVVTVVGFNLLSDGLRDLLDPHERR